METYLRRDKWGTYLRMDKWVWTYLRRDKCVDL
jgi:hypothetical protein